MTPRCILAWLTLMLTATLKADEYPLSVRSDATDAVLVEIPLPEGANADLAWELSESRNESSDKRARRSLRLETAESSWHC